MNPTALRQSTEFIGSSQFESLRIATDVIRQEAMALLRLAEKLPDDFWPAINLIANCDGAVIVTGVGKAGWVAQKISASLASTGTRSHFLHPSEAIHGDLGRVAPNDLVLAFSNSGETSEVVCLLPPLLKMGVPIIAVTSQANSTLAKQGEAVLNYGRIKEACPLGLAPSTTTTIMLAIGDALALTVSHQKGFRATDFAKFHPGGSLGKKLSLVEDLMRPIADCRVALQTETVREVYIRLGGKDRRAGAVLVNGQENQLTGIFTDSDLAKLLEKQRDDLFDRPISEVMTKSPITIAQGTKMSLAIETLACRNLSELPVINAQGEAIGIIEVTDVVNVNG